MQEYDIESAQDIQEALKDLLGETGYEKSKRSDSEDARNGCKQKIAASSYSSIKIYVPQDRKSTFEPRIVKKRQKDISDIDSKIISMYAKGMTTR